MNTNILMPGMGAAGSTPLGGTPGAGASNPYPPGQCTYGVWQYIYDHYQIALPDFPGNATDWTADAQQKGYKILQQPTALTIVNWSNTKYRPYGHVAFVTSVKAGIVEGTALHASAETQAPSTYTVYEYNFDTQLEPDTRTITVGSSDDQGIEGFIEVPGVTAGATLGGTPGAPALTDPWSEFTSGLASSEASAEQTIEGWGEKLLAGGEAALGLGVMAGGVWLVMKGQSISLPKNAGQTTPKITTKPPSTRAPAAAPTPEAPTEPKVDPSAATAIRKAQRGQFAAMTPSEVKWVQEHPAELAEGLRQGASPAFRRGGG